tara:strand:+ start:4997 stop:5845 length:849 start_codon:yes stop_codon:yes gene_type:complete
MHIKGKIIGPIGILILIIGAITAISSFSAVSEIDDFQYVEITNGTLIVDDLEGGFTVYVDYPPVDFNNNQIHDLCENIVITATHDGKWISDYGSEYSEIQNPNPQREVFTYSVDYDNRGCSTIYGAEAAWYEDRELTQIGKVCVGCMKGNTTIVAEDNVSMWIKTNGIADDLWAGVIGGFAMSCCGICFGIFGLAGGITINNGNNNPQVTSYQSGYQMTKPNYDAIPQPVYQQTIDSYQDEISPAVTTTRLTKPNYNQTSDVAIEKEKSEPEPDKGNFWDNV